MPSSTSTWECKPSDGAAARHPLRSATDPDHQRHRHRHDPGAGGLGADADLRHHGCRQFRAWRIVHAGCLCRRPRPIRDWQFLARAGGRDLADRAARRGNPRHDLAPAARPRSADHDSRHLRHFSSLTELCAVAVRPGGAQDPGAFHRPFRPLLPGLSLVPAGHRALVGSDYHRAVAVPEIRHLRDLDPRHDPGPRQGAGDGNPGAVGADRRLRDRLGHGGCQRRPVRPAGRCQPRHGARLGAEGLDRRRGRRHGQSRRFDPGGDLYQPLGGVRLAVGQPGTGRHRVLRRADPDPVVPANRPVRLDAAGVAAFVAYFSTRLRDIYFAITTLIFSQIFYVIIFTWTELTGGENGLTFSRPPLAIPGIFSLPMASETLHWFVLAVVTISYLLLRRITQSPFGMVLQSIRENEARTRAIGYPTERYKIVAVMLSGLFAGLAGVLYAVQNRFAAPDFVFFLVSGEVVIYNVIGGIGTLVGPIVGAATFLLLREGFSRFFTEFYLIPVGLMFIAMVIFMPQGLLGFARRWLNR